MTRFAESFLKDGKVGTLEAITGSDIAIQLYLKLGFEVVESDYTYLNTEKRDLGQKIIWEEIPP